MLILKKHIFMIILNYCNKIDFLKLLKLFNFDYSESFLKNKINIFFGNKAFQVRNFSNYKQLFIDLIVVDFVTIVV